MTTIKTKQCSFGNEVLDAILDGQLTSAVDNLELIDCLIARATERGVQIEFLNEQERKLSLSEAYTIRYDLGLDIR